MYRELGSFELLLISILAVFAFGALFAPSAIAQSGVIAGKNKLASDYAAKNYAGVIADGDALQKAGALDYATAMYVSQAYYLSGNKAGCVKYIQENFGASSNENILALLRRCSK